MTDRMFSRGSEWRTWDLHIHTPASFHWHGERFDKDPCSPKNATLVDEMINTMNSAKPAVFAIMDYWTFDGWFALKHRLSQPGAPELRKTVFPGIELRLAAPMKGRLNAHVLFSDKIKDQELDDFKANLRLEFTGKKTRNLSNEGLIDYARSVVADDKLKHHGLDKQKIENDENYALLAGSKMAELNSGSYKEAIARVNQEAIGFMPFDKSGGLTRIERNKHYTYFLSLLKSSPIFEISDINMHQAFSGVKTDENKEWIEGFQTALDGTPRLAVSGSDAHCFVGTLGKDDRRGYGDYPSDKITWIKADPTFEGLKQAIKEPAKRSYIGAIPPKMKIYNANKSLFIDKLIINKQDNSTQREEWLNKTDLKLNGDLLAIIGKKGSGKSALADIIALLGNSKQANHFSFLKKDRFRGKTGEPAKYFDAEIIWADGETTRQNLNEDSAAEKVELVKYIPQGHFEELCNAHVSGQSDAFERELRSVIFSHVDETVRLDSYDFENLIDQQESPLRENIDVLRNKLHVLNQKIDGIEKEMLPDAQASIEELLLQKKRILNEHERVRPVNVTEPASEPSDEQLSASKALSAIAQNLDAIKVRKEEIKKRLNELVVKQNAISRIKEGVDTVKRSVQNFISEFENDAEAIGKKSDEIFNLKVNDGFSLELEESIVAEEIKLRDEGQTLVNDECMLTKQKIPLDDQLNAPQKAYQRYLEDLKKWEEKKIKILGSNDSPDTLQGLEYRQKELDLLPNKRSSLLLQRLEIAGDIFDLLDKQRSNREILFAPVQDLIQSNTVIRDEYKLQFKAELSSTIELISNKFFAMVKQNFGEFRGESESLSVIKDLFDRHNFNEKQSMLNFIKELHNKLEESKNDQIGFSPLLRKDHTVNAVYDFIFGLGYLEPRYTLMFQDTEIRQLSPGQKGALLLIFYLLVDKVDTPIILDQPEENLDNETIVSLLVPVLIDAKQRRQIVIVTHNPNLAVVCDAEQIIYCEFDRKKGHKITYTSGSIESQPTNKKVVDVLEGTMPAFDNRKEKYY